MPDYSLVPVDYQPDFDDISWAPVDHDLFGTEDASRRAQVQQTPVQPEVQSGPAIQEADAANDNRTPQEICDQAQAMCNATARMTAAAGEAQTVLQKCEDR